MDDVVSRTRDGRALRAWESRTARPLALAALAFVLVLTLPVIDPDLTGAAKLAVDAADLTIWLVFLGDYLVRLSLAPSRWRFVRTHLPDLALVALPALRPLRILRLLSLGNLIARRSVRNLVADTSLVVAATAGLVVYLGAAAVLDAEREAPDANITSFGDALWWACSTITTVGYGDRYPVTTTGRLVAVVVMFVGIALLGVLTAGLAAWLLRQSTEAAATRVVAAVEKAEGEEERAQDQLGEELDQVLAGLAALDARVRALQAQQP